MEINASAAPRNGYAYVFISNSSQESVYFDDFWVQQQHSAILEENHYYAYGLRIAGISSRKLADPHEGMVQNNYLYNCKELDEEGDLSWYNYGFRYYDPQLGRFPQLDPLTWDYPELTNYQYASCDPILNIDVDGLEGYTSISATSSLGQALNMQGIAVGAMAVTKDLSSVIVSSVRAVKSTVSAIQVASIALKVADVATDFIPLLGGSKDIYRGVESGNWWQVGLGVGSIALDIVTLGSASVAKGAVKTVVREGAEVLLKEEAEAVLKREVKTVYERVMSKAELDATLEGEGKNLLRGGREGENFFSKAGTISNDSKRAQQRLGLDGKLREYKVKFTIDPKVNVSGPRTAKPGLSGTSGGGLEYSTNQVTKIKVQGVSKLKNCSL